MVLNLSGRGDKDIYTSPSISAACNALVLRRRMKPVAQHDLLGRSRIRRAAGQ